jgi:hypothetical protein
VLLGPQHISSTEKPVFCKLESSGRILQLRATRVHGKNDISCHHEAQEKLNQQRKSLLVVLLENSNCEGAKDPGLVLALILYRKSSC